MKKLIISILACVSLVGCANFSPCSTDEFNRLTDTNNYLVSRSVEIRAYHSGEKEIPNSHSSALTKEQLVSAYVISYNKYFDQFKKDTAAFNSKCASTQEKKL